MKIDDIKAAAQGRWPEIHATLGIPRTLLNKQHQPCPSCGGKDRFRYTDYQSGGGFICNQCTPQGGGGFDLLMLVFGWDFQTALHETAVLLGMAAPQSGQTAKRTPRQPLPPAAPEKPVKDKQAALLQRWREADDLSPESPAAQYLKSRGLTLPALENGGGADTDTDTANGHTDGQRAADGINGLRYTPKAEYWANGRLIGCFPALTAAVRTPEGELQGLHQTYLQEHADGSRNGNSSTWRKLLLQHPQTGEPLPAKKMFSRYAGAMKGAAVHLAAPDESGRLIVAEGIETALAAMELFGLPAVAALSANGMAAFEWPPETAALFIVADNDPNLTGRKAADTLARRALLHGIEANIWQPETIGFDALDELNARKANLHFYTCPIRPKHQHRATPSQPYRANPRNARPDLLSEKKESANRAPFTFYPFFTIKKGLHHE